MIIHRRYRRKLSAVLILLLLLAPLSPFAASGSAQEAQSDITTMKDSQRNSAASKVDASVMKELEKNKFVDVFIELTEQTDTSKAATEAVQLLEAGATAYNQKIASRHAVVDALRTTAETTQTPLIKYLENAKAEGEVKEYESFYIMNVISVTATRAAVEQLSYYPEVARIKENEFIPLELPEKTTGQQAPTADDGIEWNIERVQAPDVWNEFGITGEGIVVGVIDTGVQWNHEALKEKFRGYNPDAPDHPEPAGNWLDRIGNSDLPVDILEHGTHVTGTIMGQDPDGNNKIGVAPGAQWIAARAFSALGGTEADLLAAGEFMLAPDGDPNLAPDIVQNSWGGQPGEDEWYRPMVQAWRDAGILPVFSAGNSGPGARTVTPPANYPESYAVAATNSNDRVGSFSSRGPANYDGDQKPNISAPGVNIRSAIPGNGYEGGWNGTSMASPHISGAAALLLAVDASLTPDAIEEILNETAIPLTDSQYTQVPNDGYGIGLVNAFDAVSSIVDGLGFISGQVVTAGTDDTPPVIEHPPVAFGFSGTDMEMTATITDDVSVTNARLIVSHEKEGNDFAIPMSRISGNHQNGEYRGVIPHMLVQEPGFEYYIIAEDFGGNSVSTDTHYVEIAFGIVPGEYSQDFENYPTGWMMSGSWEWGKPEAGPEPVVGSNVIGTNLSGNYPHDAADLLLLPPLDLRDTGEASLRMNHWYDLEQNYDFGYIGITADYGETWEMIDTFSERGQEWKPLVIDLQPYAGSETPVFLAFELTSDSSVAYPGWYLDNVSLVGEDTEAPDAPKKLTAETSSTGINLFWEASAAPDIAGYKIYRSAVSGSGYELVADTKKTQYSDTKVEGGQEYFYVATAYDHSNNESDYSNEAFATAPSIDIVFHADFNEDDGGFTSGGANSSWEWGAPSSGPGEAYTGEKLWATNLSGNYNNNENSWIMSPEVTLSPELTMAELSFAYWQNIENNWDFGYVEVSRDGGETWDTLKGYTNVSENWNTDSLSLASYIGETIQFRFAMETDGSVARSGWYIDDVYILGNYEDDLAGSADSKDKNLPEPATMDRVAVDPAKEKLTPKKLLDYKIQHDLKTYNFTEVSSGGGQLLSVNGLPVEGTVTIVETNRTTRTNPIDGSYTLRTAATAEGETLTVLAEAYGYYPAEAQVTVADDETTIQHFTLEPLPRGSIEGTVTNSRSGEPIADAAVRLLEDANVDGSSTDETGRFVLENIFEGEYTLRVSAEGYQPGEAAITVEGGELTEVSVELSPFIGFEEEIAYDNGIAENALVLNAAGNGLGVRFTPEDTAVLRGVSLYIWDSDWPDPGGNEISIVVYDTDANGNAADRVIGPVKVEVERGGWNYIDLTEHGFITDGDFFISTLQDQIGEHSPGIGTDEENPNAERSYLYVQGAFQPHFDNGNFMIRANVAYSLDAPVIAAPPDMTYTSQDTVEVSGTVTAESTVKIYNNGELAAAVASENKQFAAAVELTEGENSIFATSEIEQGETDPSATVTIVKDSVAPEVTITSPEDGSITNKETVTVSGTATDENLDSVTVNGKKAVVEEDGSFSVRVLLDEGENVLAVEAVDLADNHTAAHVTVLANWTAPTLESIEPATNLTVIPGEAVTISFLSDSEGGNASFTVSLPSAAQAASAGVEMEETEPGFYIGTWTAPDVQVDEAVIEITMTDAAGNTSKATADGKITVQQISAGALLQLIERLEANGEIPKQGALQLKLSLSLAELYYKLGKRQLALRQMDIFIRQIDSGLMKKASPEAKALLKTSANQLKQTWTNN
ncbi:bacillopeptidase F [Evansella caseinilytica]|uniref:Bacillopeptidase F n=1 Tax=Evansella caseinilytica TaxID=1503961 RepID=A0A1H3U1T0_9BACI|nr:S8 family serine peptidase [Evansella caseinilytica]SDZ56277.1 bacillopeptidase F [Evansella caseinilytica]